MERELFSARAVLRPFAEVDAVELYALFRDPAVRRYLLDDALVPAECVPFYFCPRSVMLYLIAKANHEELGYRGGQESIVHLEADFYESAAWADRNGLRWAFTSSNAGAYYCEFYSDLRHLDRVSWAAVRETRWSSPDVKNGKQAEFLIENRFPWHLVRAIGVHSSPTYELAAKALQGADHRPVIQVRSDWYYLNAEQER